MPPFDQLLDQATHRLRIDPELQREVRHELLTHLEESAAEHRAAGINEQEAARQAIKDFGDPEPLSDQLFSANRRRIRFRQVAKWTMRAVLPPAAAVVAVSLAWGAVVYLAALMVFLPTGGGGIYISPSHSGMSIVGYENRKMRSSLSSSQRLIFDQQTGLNNDGLRRAKALADHWPDDPLYQANYVIWIATQYMVIVDSKNEKNFKPTTAISLDEVLAAIHHAESVEPENGFYNLMKAGVLFSNSTKILEDIPEKDLPGFEVVSIQGKKERYTISPIKITDQTLFKQALAEIQKAAAKPYLDSHVVDLAARRLDLLPNPSRLDQRLLQTQYSISVLLPQLNYYREIFNTIGGHVVGLAEQRQRPAVLALIKAEKAIASKMAVHCHVIVEMLVASGLYQQACWQKMMVEKIAGQPDAFQQARK